MLLFQNTKNRKPLSKSWLTAVLLLSLFSLSDVGAYSPQQKQITKTELVSSASRALKRTHSFKRAVASFHAKNFFLQRSVHQVTFVILLHQQFVNTKFVAAYQKTLTIKRATRVFEQSHIPRSSDEDIYNSTRG